MYPEECIETNAKSIKIKAIALLSDGLESYSFICNVPDTNAPSIFLDPNQPYDKFFNTNIDAVRNMRKNNISDEEITDKLHHYLLNGHPIISVEPDDKTIIVGFLNEDL
ncbi:MAG: hypothetical protein IPL20_03050 [Saprospiraceae bacterium]|nr:hypothetical protein [Saprospiraceae bacterium]